MLEHTLPYLAASELLRALDEKLVDKTQLGIEELLDYQEHIRAACPKTCRQVNEVLRRALVQARPITPGDVWEVEHFCRAGLMEFMVEARGQSSSRAAIELLRQFWLEKAETGDVLTDLDVDFVELLLANVEIKGEVNAEDENHDAAHEAPATPEQCAPLKLPAKPNMAKLFLGEPNSAKGFSSKVKSLFGTIFFRLSSRKRVMTGDSSPARKSARLIKH